MNTLAEMYSCFIEYLVFVSAIASILFTFAWVIVKTERQKLLRISISLAIVLIVVLLPYYIFMAHYLLYPFVGVRLQLLCPIMLLVAGLWVFGNFRGKTVVVAIAYILNLVFLLLGLEGLKSAGGTWGNFSLEFGVYTVFNCLLILQILTFMYESNVRNGIFKLLTGILSLTIIIVSGIHRGDEYWVASRELLARNSVILVTALLLIEGCLLIYKNLNFSKSHFVESTDE